MKNRSKKKPADFNTIYDRILEAYSYPEEEEYMDPVGDPVNINAKLDDNKRSFSLEVTHNNVTTVVTGEYGGAGVVSHNASQQDVEEILNVLLAMANIEDITSY